MYAPRISVPGDLIDEIGRCIDERGEVLDSASDALMRIRADLREAHAALMDRLQRIVASSTNAPYLQEADRHATAGPLRHPAARRVQGAHPGPGA